MSRRENLPDHVKDRVVIERIANLLQFLEQALQNTPLDRVGRDEIEDQAVFALAVAMDTAHPLLQAIGIPRDVIVEKDVAGLEVDPLPRRLGGDKHLNRTFAELLLGMKT